MISIKVRKLHRLLRGFAGDPALACYVYVLNCCGKKG